MRFTSFTASYGFIPACQVKAKIYQELVLQSAAVDAAQAPYPPFYEPSRVKPWTPIFFLKGFPCPAGDADG
jgi:hypothetical protein